MADEKRVIYTKDGIPEKLSQSAAQTSENAKEAFRIVAQAKAVPPEQEKKK